MTIESINKLCNEIIKLEGKWANGEPRIIINDCDRDIVTQTIRSFLSTTDEERELAELRAKVYTYEKIIANSNFAPLIGLKQETEVKRGEWEIRLDEADYEYYKCPFCKEDYYDLTYKTPNFCPYCGANLERSGRKFENGIMVDDGGTTIEED